MTSKLDILLVGHYSHDSILLNKQERNQAGGAVYYCAFPLAKMGMKVGVLTKVKKEDDHLLDVFRNEKNIELFPLLESKETTVTRIEYPTSNMDVREMRVLSMANGYDFSKDIAPMDITNENVKWVHIGPLYAGEVDLKFIQDLSSKYPGKLSVDVQGFIRKINEQKEIQYLEDWKDKEAVFKEISILKVDRKEAEFLTNGETNLREALKKIANMGKDGHLREIICTSSDGVLLFDILKNEFFLTPFKNKSLIGRTGRGDTTTASYLGFRVIKKWSVQKSCLYCTALVSMKMEKQGPFMMEMEQVQKFVETEYKEFL